MNSRIYFLSRSYQARLSSDYTQDRSNDKRLKPLVLAIRTLIAGGLALNAAHAELPVPTTAVTLSSAPVEIATIGQATAAVAGNALTINQGTDKARIDWQSFNISSDSRVHFAQPTSSSVALNTIHQADASRIMGQLTANGQVYLVNQNGFVFGKESSVNVNALVATTLGISDAVLQKGLTSAFAETGEAALQGNGELYLKNSQGQEVLDQHGEKIKIQIFIERGAEIKTQGSGGRVIIAAPVVNNAGTVNTPDGQAVLVAAKDKVYLQEAGSDSDIRGLLVEVGTGGAVNNTGKVLAERGNASLMGFAVNQQGMVKATSSVSLNGSVRLLAREGIQDPTGTGGKLLPKATMRTTELEDGLGTKAVVHLGKNSVTSVHLDADKTATAIDAQRTAPSNIEISGHDVVLQQHAQVQAKSGQINLTAVDDPTDSSLRGDARVLLGSGSVVDASGVKNVSLPIERNVVKVELRKNELRDAPLQRDGVLFGKTVAVDIRDAKLSYDADHNLTSATIPVADIKGAVDRIPRHIDERSTQGGSINIHSSGDVVSQPNSVLDFSGGSIAYQDGYIETTQLVANGQLYDIASADPNRHYDSIQGQVADVHSQWGVTNAWTLPGLALKHYEPGYIEGKAGGSLNIHAYESVLQGELNGTTVSGALQRTANDRAPGSVFSLDLSNNNLLGLQDISITAKPVLTPVDSLQILPKTEDDNAQTVPQILSADALQRSGINHIHLTTNGHIDVAADAEMTLPDHGSLLLSASGVDWQGSLRSPSGTVSVTPTLVGELRRPNPITLGSTASIDVSGRWINDFQDSQQGRTLTGMATEGGNVTLQAEQGDLQLLPGSRIDVSGGALLDNAAQIHAGQGGAIRLTAASHDGGGVASNLILQGQLAGYGIKQGGHLSLESSEVVIGAASDAPLHHNATTPLILQPGFFRNGGFADYSITANLYGLKVADQIQLKPQQKNRLLNDSVMTQATGSALETFSQTVNLPDSLRNATNLSLTFRELLTQNRNETLTIGHDAAIKTDAGGQVALSSDTSIMVDGLINTPGGTIDININTPTSGDKGFFAGQGIWLGEDSRLLAQGVFKPEINSFGLKTGEVLTGGNVNLAAKRGYIVTRAGSIIDVSGNTETLEFQQDTGITEQTIASAGGHINLTAGEGLLADGRFRAHSAVKMSPVAS